MHEYLNAMYKGFSNVEDAIESFHRFSLYGQNVGIPVATIGTNPIVRKEPDTNLAE